MGALYILFHLGSYPEQHLPEIHVFELEEGDVAVNNPSNKELFEYVESGLEK